MVQVSEEKTEQTEFVEHGRWLEAFSHFSDADLALSLLDTYQQIDSLKELSWRLKRVIEARLKAHGANKLELQAFKGEGAITTLEVTKVRRSGRHVLSESEANRLRNGVDLDELLAETHQPGFEDVTVREVEAEITPA